MSKPASECEDMTAVRQEVDRIDTALVDLLTERLSYIHRASELKGDPEDADVPWRVKEVIDNAVQRGEADGLPADFTRPIWTHMVQWSIQYEHKRLAERAGK